MLLHNWHHTVRFLLGLEVTNEIDGDIMVGVEQETCYQLQASGSDDRAWVWSAYDWTSGMVGWETLALEFSRLLALSVKAVSGSRAENSGGASDSAHRRGYLGRSAAAFS